MSLQDKLEEDELNAQLNDLHVTDKQTPAAQTSAASPSPTAVPAAPSSPSPPPPRSSSVLPSFDLTGIVHLISTGKAKSIIVMTGAGVSTSAGIPDFRSPGTGLYDNLQSYNLPDPQAIFTIGYFRQNPNPFITLAQQLYPTHFTPTPSHHFITLLHHKGLLLRCYTQNIDGLELLAELPRDKLIQAHGGFSESHCIDCNRTYAAEQNKADIIQGKLTRCTVCQGLVKPRIVFFGESLPQEFHRGLQRDFPQADLLIIMGTSLTVHPFASLIDRVGDDVPRLLLNKEAVGKASSYNDDDDDDNETSSLQALLRKLLGGGITSLGMKRSRNGLCFHLPDNTRDVFVACECDEGVRKLCDLLGWREELEQRIRHGYKGVVEQLTVQAQTTHFSAATTVDIAKDATSNSPPTAVEVQRTVRQISSKPAENEAEHAKL